MRAEPIWRLDIFVNNFLWVKVIVILIAGSAMLCYALFPHAMA
jgi:hypothetical protein